MRRLTSQESKVKIDLVPFGFHSGFFAPFFCVIFTARVSICIGILGPIYIMTIGLAVVLIGIPLLQSILDYAVVSTRKNYSKIEEEYAVLDFIYDRLTFWARNN